MTVEIVILAMIAAFLGLRLYAVLGRRAEHEEEPIAGRFDPPAGPARPGIPHPRQANERDADGAQIRARALPSVGPLVERELRAIAAADRSFDVLAFLEGARGAYRMVLEAFWRGDRDELRALCDDDVLNSFAAAIDARAAAGESLDNRLVRIEESQVTAASLRDGVARITVRFRADIAAVTRNAQGQVIAGSLDDALEAIDVWTFRRDIHSAAPDWLLDETDQG